MSHPVPHPHLKNDDEVMITLGDQSTEGRVVLASENGVSLMLAFEAILGGYVGMMPVMWDRERGRFMEIGARKTIELELINDA